MDYDITPDCVCGGTGTIQFSGDDPFSLIPCGECLARYDRNFCPVCDTRHTGTDPTYPWIGNNPQRRVCGLCVGPAIKALQKQQRDLLDQLRVLEDKLDVYRSKCHTCRCKILPGHGCECCGYANNPPPSDVT